MEQQMNKPEDHPMEISISFLTPQLRPKPTSLAPTVCPFSAVSESSTLPQKRMMSPRLHSFSMNSAPAMHSLKKMNRKRPVHEVAFKNTYRNSIKAVLPKKRGKGNTPLINGLPFVRPSSPHNTTQFISECHSVPFNVSDNQTSDPAERKSDSLMFGSMLGLVSKFFGEGDSVSEVVRRNSEELDNEQEELVLQRSLSEGVPLQLTRPKSDLPNI